MNLSKWNVLPVLSALLISSGCMTPSDNKQKVGIGPSFKGPIGLQLYSLRDDFAKDVPGSLKRVADYGFKYVELAGTYGLDPAKFKAMLDANGLVPVAAHFPFDRLRNDIEKVTAEAKQLGIEYVGCAWIPHEGDFDEKECRDAIAVFNRAGERVAREGMKLFYHNHGYEFQPYKDGTLFDLLMAETNPKQVFHEMDVFWVVHPGQNPAKLLDKYGSRWALMHVKDMKKGVKGDLTGKSDVRNDVVLGTGQMDWPAIFTAAKKAGIKYYFIEDESPDASTQIPQSLRFLEQLKW